MDTNGQWLKNWFLLSDNVLLYFRDSTGKERSAADGEFDLSSCCGVTEIQVHKGYGFNVQFEGGVINLAAATPGIRRRWMEEILHSIPGQPDRESRQPTSSPSGANTALKQPLGQPSVNRLGALDNHIKTLDWSEFRTVRQALEKVSGGTWQAHEKYNDWGDYLDLSSPEPPLKSLAWEAGPRVEQKENAVGVNHVSRTRCTPLADNAYTSTLFSQAAKPSVEMDTSRTQTLGLNTGLHPSNDTFKVSKEGKSGSSSSILDSQRSPQTNYLNKPSPLRLVTAEGPIQFLAPTPIRKPGDGARTDGDKAIRRPTVLPGSHLHQNGKILGGDANYGNACVDLVERPPPTGDEIEQHWEQVEKTPVNGQKQIAITCVRPSTPGCVGETCYQALNEQVEKLQEELEQVRKELDLLQEENCDLQTKLLQQKNLSGYISQAACERGLAAMQESHRIALAELHRQKDQEIQEQREEQERLLAEEAAATAAALEAMQNAHRIELERVLQTQRSSSSSSSNERTDALRRQQEELTSAQRELGVLSEQYSQKCLENSHLSQALEAERQALCHCQQENQALNAQNQKLNSRLSQELRRLRSIVTGDGDGMGQLATSTSPATYELEVMVRVKDSEIQYYKQEMNALKEQLQAALREKKYATEKYKDIYMEMSIVRAKAEMDAGRLQEKLVAASGGLHQDVMRSKSDPDFLRIEDANVSPRPADCCHNQSLGERNNLRELYYQEKEK
uniref:myosin phosphatase Rho-interacting protein-like isoform X2 n=1 Tax=Myxine glutinosa TaxID=7769 RepID=UPI00358E6915